MAEATAKEFRGCLAAARRAGVNFKRLALAARVSRPLLFAYLSGATPRPKTIKRILDALATCSDIWPNGTRLLRKK